MDPSTPLLVLQEGFVDRSELVAAKANGVDAVFLGEELLADKDGTFKDIINAWK
jgi:hypothetical protein